MFLRDHIRLGLKKNTDLEKQKVVPGDLGERRCCVGDGGPLKSVFCREKMGNGKERDQL